MIYDPFTYAAVNYCSCKNPIFVRFKEPREINGQLVQGCKVPCGKCELCKKRRQREWFVRLNSEWKHSQTAFFVTLTYDDVHIPCNDGIVYVSKKDCQDFMKRLRKPLGKHRVSYFLVSEYGDQFKRPHYHMLLFNYPLIDLESVKKSIEEAWQNGLVSVGTVSGASINYCTKYCLKNENQKENCPIPTFMLCSRRPAIGASFLSREVTKFYQDSEKGTTWIDGCNYPLPAYYKRKLWTDEERASMYVANIEDMCNDLSSMSERVGGLRSLRKLQKEQIESKCNEIRRKQELGKMRKNASERKFKMNQHPNSKKL